MIRFPVIPALLFLLSLSSFAADETATALPPLLLEFQESLSQRDSGRFIAKLRENKGESIPQLIECLKSKDPQQRDLAAQVFQYTGADGAPALPVLIECAHLQDRKFQEQCIYAIRSILEEDISNADVDWDRLIPELMKLIHTTSGNSCANLLWALGNCGVHARSAVPEMLVLAEQGEQTWRAIEALREILLPARENDPYVQDFIDLLIKKWNSKKSRELPEIFGEAGSAAAQILPELYDYFEDTYGSCDRDAFPFGSLAFLSFNDDPPFMALLEIGPPKDEVILRWLEHPSVHVRKLAEFLLWADPLTRDVNRLTDYLTSDSDGERCRAVSELNRILMMNGQESVESSPELISALTKALDDPLPYMRRSAFAALYGLQPEKYPRQYIPLLAGIYNNDFEIIDYLIQEYRTGEILEQTDAKILSYLKSRSLRLRNFADHFLRRSQYLEPKHVSAIIEMIINDERTSETDLMARSMPKEYSFRGAITRMHESKEHHGFFMRADGLKGVYPETIPLFDEEIRKGNALTRGFCAAGLVAAGTQAISAIAALLKDADTPIRESLLVELTQWTGPPDETGKSLYANRDDLQRLFREAGLDLPSRYEPWIALAELIYGHPTEKTVEYLIEYAGQISDKHSSGLIKGLCLNAIRSGYQDVFIRKALGYSHLQFRVQAARVAWHEGIRGERCIQVLIEGLRSPDEAIQREALFAFSESGDGELPEPIRTVLLEEFPNHSFDNQMIAARIWGSLGKNGLYAVPLLKGEMEKLLLNEKVGMAAVVLTISPQDRDAAQILKSGLESEDRNVEIAIHQGLAYMARNGAFSDPSLCQALLSEQKNRAQKGDRHALEILAWISEPPDDVVPIWQELLTHRDFYARDLAAAGLKKIGKL